MNRHSCRRLCTGALMLLLAGCASAEPEWYRLVPVPGPAFTRPSVQIELRDVRLARALDRPGILTDTGGTRLTIADEQRWIGPLDEMTTQILRQNLAQRVPGSNVAGERDATGSQADFVIGIDIDRFEAVADDQARLSASFSIRRPGPAGAVVAAGRAEERARPSGPGTDALVLALSETLGRLADRLAAALSNQLQQGDRYVPTNQRDPVCHSGVLRSDCRMRQP